jgi:multidrug efflux pump
LVSIAIENARLTLSVLLFLIVAGSLSYISIPKEAEPDIQIPIIYVSLGYQGISPEDSERLLLRPMESKLKTIADIKEMRSTAYQGGGNVIVEFQAGANLNKALDDVRNKVSDAKRDLPQGADEPTVNEVNISEFPVLVVTLSGNVPERALTKAARELRDRIKDVTGVLDAALQGSRDELVEVIIDPMKLSSYGLRLDQLIAGIGANNSLVAAGALEGEEGRYTVKVPALIESVEDVANLPIVAGNNAVVRARDLAEIRSTFKDAESVTRLNGIPAIAIEVSKRTGSNLIQTVDSVKKIADEFGKLLPPGAEITYSQDKSTTIRQLLSDLQNSVLTAVILVFIVILFSLSGRASILIGLAIPASFLMGILGLELAGLTVNLVVLFSLILAVGMLVDDAIIVTEFAERRMSEGMEKKAAFTLAASRMSGPVIAATMTRVAAFSPLLFWPGIVGEFMKYMPITLIATLSASMAYALIFAPTLGVLISKPHKVEDIHHDGLYMWVAKRAIRHPFITLALTVGILVAVPMAYGKFGKGAEFFPNVEPEFGLLYVHARGNLSLEEKDTAVREAESRILGWPGIKTVYTRVGRASGSGNGQSVAEDVVGVIQYEFVDWKERKKANEILDDLRSAMTGIPGVEIEVSVPQAGPPTGKAIQIRLSAADPSGLSQAAREVAAQLSKVPDIVDVSDGLPPPGIDWELKVDRTKAALFGIGPASIGTVVQLVTTGLKLSDYRPAGADDAVDIRLRLPQDRRTLSTLDELRVETAQGSVPISNFVTREPAPSTGTLNRIDGARTVTVEAGIREGIQADAVRNAVKAELEKSPLNAAGIRWKMAGADEEQAAAGAFLAKAFGAAIFLIFVVLLAQFNKFISVGLVLSAVVMSTIGVLLGLLIMGQPFGVVMTGIGVIALAGVVVNNNIVLIDTYDHLRREGMEKMDAILQTCRERARPVVLTAITAILGVLPIAFGFNLELLNHETTFGAPSTQWWISLSSAIVFGLAFSTVLTLIVTPSLLMIVTRSNDSKGLGLISWLRKRFSSIVPSRSKTATDRG